MPTSTAAHLLSASPSTAQEASSEVSWDRAPGAVLRETHRIAEKRQARATMDRGLFHRQYNRVRVRDLSSLWPYDDFRQAVLVFAERWVSDYEKKGYRLLSPMADIAVLGPYPSRNTAAMIANRPSALRVIGSAADEDAFPDQADVVLEAMFLVPYMAANGRQEMEEA